MSDLLSLGFTAMMVAIAMNMVIASYGIFAKPSVIKKLLSLIIFSDSINMLAVAIGFKSLEQGYPSPPILVEKPRNISDIEAFTRLTVDPLPQALVITAIVIGLAVILFLFGLALLYYKLFGSTNINISLEEEEDEEIV